MIIGQMLWETNLPLNWSLERSVPVLLWKRDKKDPERVGRKILDGKSSGQIACVGLKGTTGCFTEACERMFSRIAVLKGF